jgi:hypothetical protein
MAVVVFAIAAIVVVVAVVVGGWFGLQFGVFFKCHVAFEF